MEPTIRLEDARAGRRDQRGAERRRTSVPGRLVWRDARRATRFASVLIRDASEQGVFVECLSGTAIPLYRLVFLQAERGVRGHEELPEPLRQGRVLSAVYRIGPLRSSTGLPQGYALRLLVEPRRRRGTANSTRHASTPAEVYA